MNVLIGHKIKRLRTQKGMSQEQVAEHLHIAQSTYARIENGESNSWATYIEPLSKLFEIQPDELLKQGGHVFNQKNKKGDNNGLVFNQLSEKLIEQYELRINEKDQYIKRLEQLLDK